MGPPGRLIAWDRLRLSPWHECVWFPRQRPSNGHLCLKAQITFRRNSLYNGVPVALAWTFPTTQSRLRRRVFRGYVLESSVRLDFGDRHPFSRVLGVCILEAVKAFMKSHPETGSYHRLESKDL